MSKHKTTQRNITTNKDKETAKALGRKLGFLISASTMDDDLKESWITIFPQMSLEQIARLIDIMEAKYLDEQTTDINKKLEQELGIIKKKYQEKREIVDQNVLGEINKLEEKLAVSSV